jgi:PAS domain S-box-containing protein
MSPVDTRSYDQLTYELEASRSRIASLEAILVAIPDIGPGLLQELNKLGANASQEHYQFIAHHVGDVVWILDAAESRFCYVGPDIIKLRGFSDEETLKQTLDEVISPAGLALINSRMPDRLNELQAGEELLSPRTADIELHCKDGSTIWAETTAIFLKTPDGNMRVLGAFRDISKRKEIETSFHSSDSRFRAFVEQSADGIGFTDEQGVFIGWNPVMARLTGLSAEQVLGKPFWEVQAILVPPGLRNKITPEYLKEMMASGLATGNFHMFGRPVETTLETVDGKRIPVQQISFPIRTDKGFSIGGIVRELSDRHNAEEAEEKFSKAFQTSPQLMAISELKGNTYLEVNNAFLRTLGYTREEVIGHSVVALNLFANLDQRKEALTVLSRDGRLENFEIDVRTKSGEIRNGLFCAEFIDMHDQRLLLTVMNDITALKHAESTARSSLNRFRSYVESSPMAVMVSSPDGLIVDINQAAALMLGYPLETLRSMRSEEIIGPALRVIAEEKVAELSKTGKTELETQLIRGDGQAIWVHVRAVILENGHFLAYLQDISERKRAEHALQASETRYRAIYEGATEGIITFNLRKDSFVFVNPAMCNLFGYTLEEFLQLKVPNLHPEAAIPRVVKEFAALVQGEKHQVDMIPCRRKSGRLFYSSISVSRTELDGDPVIIAFFSDVTEQRRNDMLLKARLLLSSLSIETSLDELLQKTLDEAELVTESQIGYFHFIDEDQTTIALQNWSTNTVKNMCKADGKGRHYPADQAGVWADSLRQRKAIIYNDYTSLTERKGMPEGHAAVNRFITVPVLRNEKVVAMIGVGNKEVDYDSRDVELVELLANEAWDIILRKRAENALLESEELYRTLIESQESVIAQIDLNGIFHYVNQTAAVDLGKVPTDIIGKHMNEVFPPQYAERQLGNIQKVINSKDGMIVEARTFIQNRPRWYRTSIQPVRDSNGNVASALVNSVDITIHKEMEILLEEKVRNRTAEIEAVRQRLELATNCAGLGIWECNLNTSELIWDDQMFKIYNLPRGKFHGSREDWKICVHPDDLAGQEALSFTTPTASGEYASEFRIFWPDGSQHVIGTNTLVIYDQAGRPERMIGIDFDITARRETETVRLRSEELLRHANDELERAMRMKDEFLASMSHELRTPLTGILGLSEALQMKVYGEMNAKQTKALANIETAGQHLLNLINDILDVSKIEAGKLELQYDQCSLSDICQASIQLVKGLAEKKYLKVGFSMDPALISLYADVRRLKQILVNLLTNAVKFTPEGGSIGLQVRSDEEEETLFLTVWDKGIGIQPEDLHKLFKPFVQVDSSLSRAQSGTGLGLVLVQRLAELHGGSIQVESAAGEGSRFTVILPWVRSTVSKAGPDETASTSLQRALTVEDNEFEAEHLSRYLRLLGVENSVCAFGKLAIQKAIDYQPAIILLDLHLPDQSGWTILQALKAEPRTWHIPVIITSVEDSRAKAAELGACDYLVKPYSVGELRSALLHSAAAAQRSTPVLVVAREQSGTLVTLVDDNKVNSQIVVDFLEDNGLRVNWINNGIDFLERAAFERPNIVLMDIQMPGIDGLETIRRLRANPDTAVAKVPIIALTALAMPGDRERCLKAGANDYISKPFRLMELLKMIRALLESDVQGSN